MGESIYREILDCTIYVGSKPLDTAKGPTLAMEKARKISLERPGKRIDVKQTDSPVIFTSFQDGREVSAKERSVSFIDSDAPIRPKRRKSDRW